MIITPREPSSQANERNAGVRLWREDAKWRAAELAAAETEAGARRSSSKSGGLLGMSQGSLGSSGDGGSLGGDGGVGRNVNNSDNSSNGGGSRRGGGAPRVREEGEVNAPLLGGKSGSAAGL